MLNAKTTLEYQIEGRNYVFMFPNNAPIGEIHDSLTRMKSYVAQQIASVDQKEQKCSEECNGNAEHQ